MQHRPLILLFSALLTLLMPPATSFAQLMEESPYEPSLGLAFPLKQEPGQVLISQKVMLNFNDILLPGTIARTIIALPQKNDRDVVMKNKRKNLESTFARQPSKMDDPTNSAERTAIVRAAEERAVKNSWTDEMLFRGMLHRINLENYVFVFQTKGDPNLFFGQLQLPEEMLLCEDEKGIIVLSLDKECIARHKGIVAGARLLAYNDKPVKSLEEFRDRYLKEKDEYRTIGKPLRMTFQLKDKPEPYTIDFKTPHSLDSNPLMQDLPGQK